MSQFGARNGLLLLVAYLRYLIPVLGLVGVFSAYADWRSAGLSDVYFIPIAAAVLWLIYQSILVGGWVKELLPEALIRAKSYLLLLICLNFALAFIALVFSDFQYSASPENQLARGIGAAFGTSILPALGLVYLVRSKTAQMQFSTAARIEVASDAGQSFRWSTAFWFPLAAIIAAVLGAGFLANTQGSRTPAGSAQPSEPAHIQPQSPAPQVTAPSPRVTISEAGLTPHAAASVQAGINAAMGDRAAPEPIFPSDQDKIEWLTEMSRRLEHQILDRESRIEFLKTVYFEARRAGLDPQLILALIEASSGFKKYTVSATGARGYLQVSPTWVALIGRKEDNLFHLRTNLRFGCTILRHYLDTANGDLLRALATYRNQMLARDENIAPDDFPNQVRGILETKWAWTYSAPSPSN